MKRFVLAGPGLASTVATTGASPTIIESEPFLTRPGCGPEVLTRTLQA